MITPDVIQQRVKQLPTLPTILWELQRAVADDRCTVDKVLAVLSKDPPLSAALLRLANSASYASSVKIESLKNAVLRLGFDEILNLGRTAAIIRHFKRAKQLDALKLWQHSVAVGLTAKGICRLKKDRHNEEGAFLAGLLHDIGKFTLDYCFEEEYAPVLEAVANGECGLDAEQRILGITHAEIGAIVASNWHFPDAFVDAIRQHHHPSPDALLANLICFSDLMVRTRIPNSPHDEQVVVVMEELPTFHAIFEQSNTVDLERFTFGIDDELDHAIGFVQLAFQE